MFHPEMKNNAKAARGVLCVFEMGIVRWLISYILSQISCPIPIPATWPFSPPHTGKIIIYTLTPIFQVPHFGHVNHLSGRECGILSTRSIDRLLTY